jgi:hypothetical protein
MRGILKNIVLVCLGTVVGIYFQIIIVEKVVGKNVFVKPLLSPIPDTNLISPTPNSVLGTETTSQTSIFQIPTPTSVILTPITPIQRVFKKKIYTISLVGDSMMETCGLNCPYLGTALDRLIPEVRFTILNNSVGGTDILNGFNRLTNPYEYQGQQKPVLVQDPDIVIIESFAYNHWSSDQTDIDKYWLTLAHIVDTLKLSKKKILFLATIAPNSVVYAKTAPGINWSEADRWEQAKLVRLYLDTFIGFAKSQNIPLIDVYHESLDVQGEGDLSYIEKGTYIHPSVAGFRLISDRLAQGILLLLD